LIDDIVRAGIAAEADEPSIISMTDEDDRIFYDTAKASNAFLITGNIRHFPQESFILTPANFLKEYQRAL
jgi:predicted nucleic acid-binding protein